MKYAIMSLDSLKLMDYNEEQPIYFETCDEAETFIQIYSLINVAIVPLDEEELCVKGNTAPK